MTALPWIKFFPRDWREEPKLYRCSGTARLVWFEVLMFMHARELEPYGHLALDGAPMPVVEIAREIRLGARTVSAALKELEAAGVCSKTETGIIYSRRMVRDGKRRAHGLASGPRGGNPALRRRGELPCSSDIGLSKGERSEGEISETTEALSESMSSASLTSVSSETVKAKPHPLDEPEFACLTGEHRAAFCEWELYRREIKKPLTERSIRQSLRDLAKDPVGWIASSKRSIANGWQGLFPERAVPANSNGASPPPTRTRTIEDIRRERAEQDRLHAIEQGRRREERKRKLEEAQRAAK